MPYLDKIVKKIAGLKAEFLFDFYNSKFNSNINPIPQNINNEEFIIYSAPEGLIDAYQKNINLIYEKNHIEGYYLRCYDYFEMCSAKQMVIGPGKNVSRKESLKICNSCNKHFYKHNRNKKIIDIGFVSSKDTINHQIFKNLSIQELLSYEYKGIKIGELSLYDLFILHKIRDIELVESYRIDLERLIIDGIRYIKIFEALTNLKKLKAVYFIDHYSSLSCCRNYLTSLKIKNFSIYQSAFNNLQNKLIKITEQKNFQISLKSYKEYLEVKDIPLSYKIIKKINNELLSRQVSSGPHIYSLKKGNSIRFNYSSEKTVIVAFNNSNDEFEAYQSHYDANNETYVNNDVFKTQYEWLDFLINKVEESSNFFLYIRLHPRIYRTFRDNQISQEYYKYKEKYGKTYKNTMIIWPETKISSYDLFDICDVATVAWSSIGDELSRMGIPVVTGINKFVFNFDNINIFKAKSNEHFWELVCSLSQRKLTFEHLAAAYRLYYFRYLAQYLDFLEAGKVYDLTNLDEYILMSENYKNIKSNIEIENHSINEIILNTINFLNKHSSFKNKSKLVTRLKMIGN